MKAVFDMVLGKFCLLKRSKKAVDPMRIELRRRSWYFDKFCLVQGYNSKAPHEYQLVWYLVTK